MKKQSIRYGLALGAALLVGTASTVIASNVNANVDNDKSVVLAVNDVSPLLATEVKKINNKNETVYAITDHAGSVNNLFIGSTLYTGNESLPFSVNISYFLNGEEISAKDLAGKSGHVKIVYDYTSTNTFQGKQIPFIAITGLTLDGAKFSNVKTANGKIISENDSYIIAGYSFPGLGYDLDAEFLPSSFVLEADTSSFALGTTYTILLNDVIADLDTSKLSEVDGLVNSINQLSSGLNQIVAGSAELSNGTFELSNGVKALQAGVYQLTDGADALVDGSEQLAAGLDKLNDVTSGVVNKIDETTDIVTEIIKSVIEKYHIDPDSQLIADLNARIKEYYDLAYSTVTEYTDGVAALASGATELADGISQLASGAHQLKVGVDQLATGADQLASGSVTLRDGLNTFKASGIDRLVSFANNDMANFTRNARTTVAAANSYRHFGDNATAESVKFIIKTPSI